MGDKFNTEDLANLGRLLPLLVVIWLMMVMSLMASSRYRRPQRKRDRW
jgi:hypothetical protein